jgi:2-methylisocitrate lyase-like PEP mutase family enzyme
MYPRLMEQATTRAAEAGAVGGSIEDWDRERAIHGVNRGSERIAAARQAADGLGFPFTLTARGENFTFTKPGSVFRLAVDE